MKSNHQPPMQQGSPDDFQTPKIAIKCLLPFIRGDWTTIWECACGKSYLKEAFEEENFEVIATDIIYDKEQDFLKWSPEFNEFDMIITNPPYSLKEKFLERCYEIGKPFALLMPLTALESEKRQKLYRKYGIQLIIPNKRFNFETPSGKGSGSWFATAWFCGNMNLSHDLNFVKLT